MPLSPMDDFRHLADLLLQLDNLKPSTTGAHGLTRVVCKQCDPSAGQRFNCQSSIDDLVVDDRQAHMTRRISRRPVVRG